MKSAIPVALASYLLTAATFPAAAQEADAPTPPPAVEAPATEEAAAATPAAEEEAPTTAPVAFESPDETTEQEVTAAESAPDLDAPASEGGSPVVSDSTAASQVDRGALGTVVVGMSAIGVMVLAAVVTWVRPTSPRRN